MEAALFRKLLQNRSLCYGAFPSTVFSRRPLLLHGSYHKALLFGPKFETRNSHNESSWQQRTDILPKDKRKEFQTYQQVSAGDLKNRAHRPRRVKMLMRDFIEDSLYNPNYGYFSKQAVILSLDEPFSFTSIADEPQFYKLLGQRYTEFEDKLDEQEFDETRQLWHTPTELFRPYYGEAFARYLITNYKLSAYPYHDLLIYEIGAGNGTFMLNVLDFIRNTDAEVYARTKFKIIEVSSSLASVQEQQLRNSRMFGDHADKVEIVNRSIFDWTTYVPSPCFFIALEVFDNFAHDCIRHDPVTGKALQGSVLIDANGDMYEFYIPYIEPIASRYLRVRDAACHPSNSGHLAILRFLQSVRQKLPFAPNLSMAEFLPTRLMQFFDILHHYFPAHKLVCSDFHRLPGAIGGINAPVVQTRYKRRTVPVSTPLVLQGYFDILFPTDFQVMEGTYRAITGKLTRVVTQEDFLRTWADIDSTQTRSGENPLLTWYSNASVMTTV